MPQPVTNPIPRADIFTADPCEISDEDFETLIDALRSDRDQFIKNEEIGKRPTKGKVSRKKKSAPSLDDLGL